jgi:olefin beta-lactone synthetase
MPSPGAATANLSEHLSRVAERLPERPAVICVAAAGRGARVAGAWAGRAADRRGARDACGGSTRSHSWTFRDLERTADRLAHAFRRIGIGKGVRTILMVRPSFELFAITFALLRTGAVPVMIDPGMGRQRLVDNLSAVGAGAFIGVPLAQALRVASPGRFPTVKATVTVGRRLFWGGHTLAGLLQSEPWRPFSPEPSLPEDTAAIFFTTGSTGPPKGVVYEHAMLDAQVRYLHTHFDYTEGDVDLATFPLFSLFDAVLGVTSVIPAMNPTKPGSADPARIAETVRTHRCTSLYGSPTLLENLARWGRESGATLPTLKRVVTAGAPVRPAVLEDLHAMLPEDARIHTPYGATEALPVSSIESREVLATTRRFSEAGAGTCVGRPLEGLEVAIIRITEDPLATWAQAAPLSAGQIGEIAVKGPNVTKEYFRKSEPTRFAKIADDREGDGHDHGVWHRMGDVGHLDDEGRLWFCGRKAHRVETAEGTLFTVPCEAVFNRHPRVRRSALVGVGEPGRQRPVIIIEMQRGDPGNGREALTEELLALGTANPLTASIRTVLYHPRFPVDIRHNAKIRREVLADWAERKLAR